MFSRPLCYLQVGARETNFQKIETCSRHLLLNVLQGDRQNLDSKKTALVNISQAPANYCIYWKFLGL